MQKLSPAYRDDEFKPIDPQLRDFIDEHYFLKQPNINKANPQKVMILFAAGSGVGKSTLSKAIQDAFGGITIENDGIKRALHNYRPLIERDSLNAITWNYTLELYERLESLTKNHFIIRDGMIHWYFDRLFPIFRKAGFKTIVIQYDLTLDKYAELIRKRGDTPNVTAERLVGLLPDHEIHMARFLKEHTPDIVINETNLYDHDRVIAEIERLLKSTK